MLALLPTPNRHRVIFESHHSRGIQGLGTERRNRGILQGMPRPCFLVLDREYATKISTHKLVIEATKLNVITAYSRAGA